MIKVIYGTKGMGKTKTLVDTANSLIAKSSGDIVFIDDSSQLMYDLKHEVRFINVAEFPVVGASGFLGFICGIISENYDIDSMLIDGVNYIVKENIASLSEFFSGLKQLAEKYDIDFYVSANGDPENVPEFIKEFMA